MILVTYVARGRRPQTDDDRRQGRLAGARFTHDPQAFVVAQQERDVAQRAPSARLAAKLETKVPHSGQLCEDSGQRLATQFTRARAVRACTGPSTSLRSLRPQPGQVAVREVEHNFPPQWESKPRY